MDSLKLEQIFESLQTKRVPQAWQASKARIKKDYEHFHKMLKRENPPRIYGVNTFVGHLDHESISTEEIFLFQEKLINNHRIGIAPFFDAYTARCISFVKVNQISMGGTSISPELYELLLDVLDADDFQPEIPKHASYSSGDVIPGAHWAVAVQTYLAEKTGYKLQPKEGLSLINGSFIHVGSVLALFPKLNNVWKNFVYNSMLNALLVNANKTNYSAHLYTDETSVPTVKIQKQLFALLDKQNNHYKKQDPVSIRALPQILVAFYDAIAHLKQTLEIEVNNRSDNPLILFEVADPLSQGSFLAPNVTLDTSKTIESILMVMWHIERRVHYLLSGEVEGIPQNGANAANALGYIQVPKLITATLEKSRVIGSRRSFASGGVTSYGTEDFWTHGVETANILEKLIKALAYMLSIERIVSTNVYHEFFDRKVKGFHVPKLDEAEFHVLSEKYRDLILNGETTFVDDIVELGFL